MYYTGAQNQRWEQKKRRCAGISRGQHEQPRSMKRRITPKSLLHTSGALGTRREAINRAIPIQLCPQPACKFVDLNSRPLHKFHDRRKIHSWFLHYVSTRWLNHSKRGPSRSGEATCGIKTTREDITSSLQWRLERRITCDKKKLIRSVPRSNMSKRNRDMDGKFQGWSTEIPHRV